MSTYFFYEDGQGNICDENGRDAMECEEEINPFHLKTLTRLRLYCEKQNTEQKDTEMEEIATNVKINSGRSYNNYTNDQKLLFVYYNRIKLFNAAKSGRLAGGVAQRTAQKWARRLKEDKDWNIFEKQTNKINKSAGQLDEKHKIHLLNFYDSNPQARVVDAVCSLTEKFGSFTLKESSVRSFLKTEYNLSFKKITCHLAPRNDPTKIANRIAWVEKWSKTDMDYLENCVFVDESAFDINMRPPGGWSIKGTPAIVITPTTRAVSHTVLGAISAKYVVSMELRNPQEHTFKRLKIDSGNRKRKAPSKPKKPASKGTVTGHYMNFIQKTMDEMDCIPEMKGYYIVMDNAPIHTPNEIDTMVTERGYKCIYLPPYSPELNPIEQFWSIVKNKVKRSQFQTKEDLSTRITEACNNVPPSICTTFGKHI